MHHQFVHTCERLTALVTSICFPTSCRAVKLHSTDLQQMSTDMLIFSLHLVTLSFSLAPSFPCFCRVRSRAWGVRPTVRFGIRHSTKIQARKLIRIHLINGVLWQLWEERETRECKAAESISTHFCNASKSGSNRTNTKLICFALNLLLGEDRCSDFYLKDFRDKIHSDSFCVKILKNQ